MSDEPTKTEAASDDPITKEERRTAMVLVANDGISGLLGKGPELTEVLDYVLSAICIELAAVSIKAEEETAPALQATGAMLGGLFGMATTADDEVLVGLHAAGQRMRAEVLGEVPA